MAACQLKREESPMIEIDALQAILIAPAVWRAPELLI
jgi:hypothetical protein